MPIKYSLSRRRNPQAPEEPRKLYASVQTDGEVDIDSLAEEVAYATSLTDGDVVNVLRAMTKRIIYHITEGRIVRLDTLGDFRPTLSGEGVKEEEDFNESKIHNVRVLFRPGEAIRKALHPAALRFEKTISIEAREAAAKAEREANKEAAAPVE